MIGLVTVVLALAFVALTAYAFHRESRFPALRTDQIIDSHRIPTQRAGQ